MYKLKTLCFFTVLGLLGNVAFSSPPLCRNINMANASVDSVCFSNSGSLFHKSNSYTWESNAEKWQANQIDLLSHPDAIRYCIFQGMMLPTVEDFQHLNQEFKNAAGRIQSPFPLHPKETHLSHEFWTATFFSSAMAYLWDPDTGITTSRYFTDYNFRVMCLEKK